VLRDVYGAQDTVFLEAVSKPQMVFDGKARADEKAQHTREVCEHFEEVLNVASGH
jgi:hypothetical protein